MFEEQAPPLTEGRGGVWVDSGLGLATSTGTACTQVWLQVLSGVNKLSFYVRLVPKLFYKCDQGQADPVVAVARDQSSVYLKLLMHETQPPSHFSVSTITRYDSQVNSPGLALSRITCPFLTPFWSFNLKWIS